MPSTLFDANLESITQANEFLHSQLENENLNFMMMELAIEEVLVNVINYAYQNPEHLEHQDMIGKIEFGIRKIRFDNKPFLSIWVRDWGHAFDPFVNIDNSDTLDMEIEERPIGGLGVHLIKTVSSHQCYSADDNTNVIEMFFEMPN